MVDKTFCGACWAGDKFNRSPGNGLICAPTYKILQQSTLPKFFEIWSNLKPLYKKSDSTITIGDKTIYIRSTEDPNSLEGMTLDWAWLDEAGQMKFEAWVNIQGRLSIKQGPAMITTTPYSLNWLYREFYQRWKDGDTDFKVIQFQSVQNPYFPEEEFAAQKKRLDPRVFDMRYKGMFRKMQGLVYDLLPGQIIEPTQVSAQKCIFGIDFGFNNPTSIGIYQRDKDGIWYKVYEYYKSGLVQDEINAKMLELKEKWKFTEGFADSAEPDRIESMNRAGIITKPAQKDIVAGIDYVRGLFRENRLFISKDCKNTVEELETYHYKDDETDKPEKDNDHAMDEMRYALYSEHRVPELTINFV